ncbi:hypothetical protein BLNAU_7707 [Blattamonas nauphoetae]|uniref:SPRY domain-containing protein n=1 Tax=Blattamonas nauphoetae TaxID=2049346 RepID=A0ABQ9Y0T0_9EUKA|nr:hypothetical protein BLNAU_7707 [Blattamonas nauphoetae]
MDSPFSPQHLLINRPSPLQTLPPMDFADPSHFFVEHSTITKPDLCMDNDGYCNWSSILLSNPFTSGIASVTITILSISDRSFNSGLMDSTSPIPEIGEALGYGVKNSVSLSRHGSLFFNTPSSHSVKGCTHILKEGDSVRMEVDLDSTPRTVQFFVNGEAGECCVSGIPSSVRIGFSLYGEGTSFRIDNISRLSQPTPISKVMREGKW